MAEEEIKSNGTQFEGKEEYVKDVFTEIASYYDEMNDIMSLKMIKGWHQYMMKLAGDLTGKRCADIGTGTGEIAYYLAEKVGPEGEVVGIDITPEMLKYDMLDTLMCEARPKDFKIRLVREKPSKQFLVNKVRTDDRSAYITFMAPYVWIDSLWVKGFKASELITQFNVLQDSLEIWINNRKPAPDTLHLFVNYRKTDSLGVPRPERN